MEWEVSSGGGEEERRGEMPRDGGQRGKKHGLLRLCLQRAEICHVQSVVGT